MITACAVAAAVPAALAAAPSAHAAPTGSYSSADVLAWSGDGATQPSYASSTINVPDSLQQVQDITLTLHGFTSTSTSGLQLFLQSPDTTTSYLLCSPTTVAGSSSPSGVDVVFSTDGTTESGEPSCHGSDLNDNTNRPGTGTWTLSISDGSGGTDTGSISGWDLSLGEPAMITSQPSDQTVTSGHEATFTVGEEGMPVPTVQWQWSKDGNTWTDVVGATSDTYVVAAPTTALDGRQYRAVVSNSAATVDSVSGYLTVNGTKPHITSEPTSKTVVAGTNATFTSKATADPAPSEHWQVSTNGGSSWANISGATSSSYTVRAPSLAANGHLFRAVFSNRVGATKSTAAKLTVTGHVPSVPRNLHAKQTGAGTITVYWSVPSSKGTPATILHYTPGYAGSNFGSGKQVGGTTMSTTFKGLKAGSYKASVAAENAAGSSSRVFVSVTVH